jgi:Ribbon-helix-helix protein, copG family.
MPKDLFIKDVPDDIYNKLEEVAKQTGRSKKDIVIEALILRLSGMQYSPSGDLVEITEPRLTILKFPAKCARCGQRINEGEEAFLAKAKYQDAEKWVAWHFSCLMTDKQLTKLYIEIRKLKRIRDQLKKEVEELADLVIDAEARKKILDFLIEISQDVKRATLLIEEYMSVVERSKDLQTVQEMLQKNH